MIFCLVIDLFRYCIEFILCSIIQIMQGRSKHISVGPAKNFFDVK